MGCDIHLYVEKVRTVNGEKRWANCDNWKLNDYYEKDNNDGEKEYTINNLYGDRNYHLFAILADVRNYSDEKIISPPRGLPKDISPHTQKESDYWASDGHSHSFFTLAELKKFAAENNITKYSGFMTPEDASKVDCGEMPSSWCQGTSDKSYVYREWQRSETQLSNVIAPLDKQMRKEFWIFNNNENPELEKQIRIVFWFDN